MKEKKKKNIIGIVLTILQILCFLSFIFLAFSIYLISGIETEIRYMVIGVLLILNIGILFLRRITRKKKTYIYIIYIVIISILLIGQSLLGYFVYRTYSSIANINKDKITYTSDLVVLKESNITKIDNLKGKKIGIVEDDTSIDGYILGIKLIEEEKINNIATIIDYDDINNLISDLYSKDIDAIIISDNYISMFKSNKEYENIEKETLVIKEKSQTYTKEEIAKVTGEEMLNLNSSDSVTKPFTILVMGIDSTADTLSKNATSNGDALMLVTFNPKTLNATILSIPRDTYVYIPRMGVENKITHAAWGGTSSMINTIQKFTGLTIDYYVKINFKGVVKLVDALGGITVTVPESLDGVCEQNSDRNSSSGYKQCFTKGVQTLTGEEALAMARHRKTLATGDFERGLNQQIVVQGILNQLKTIRSANQALEILDAIIKNIDTNFTTKQLLSFYEIAKTLFKTSTYGNLINMQQLYLSGSSQMIRYGTTNKYLVLYNYIPNKCSLNEIVNIMKTNLTENTKLTAKKIDFDIEETFVMTIKGKNPSCGTTLYKLVPNVVGLSVSKAQARLQAVGITPTIEEKEVTEGTDGVVLSQSIANSYRADLVDKFTIVVAKLTKDNESNTTGGDTTGGSTTGGDTTGGDTTGGDTTGGDTTGGDTTGGDTTGGNTEENNNTTNE